MTKLNGNPSPEILTRQNIFLTTYQHPADEYTKFSLSSKGADGVGLAEAWKSSDLNL